MNTDLYDTAQICLNGHSSTDSYHDYPQFRKDFCSECGEQTITKCPNCSSDIRGAYRASESFRKYRPPSFCQNCGHSFPWTERALDAARELADEFNELEESEITQLKESIGKLVKGGPASVVAENRFKNTMTKVSEDSNRLMRDLLKESINENLNKSLFGK